MTDDNMPDVQPDNSDTLELRTFFNKDVYNSAIEACIAKLKTDFVAPDVVCRTIRKLKK